MENHRVLKIYFNDGSKIAIEFPKQTSNEAAAQLKFDDILQHRQILIELEGSLVVVPFENINYFQFSPAPAVVRGHTYITGATLKE